MHQVYMCAGPTLWLFLSFITYKNKQLFCFTEHGFASEKIESPANEQLLCKIHTVS